MPIVPLDPDDVVVSSPGDMPLVEQCTKQFHGKAPIIGTAVQCT
jgi:hypothetical protein